MFTNTECPDQMAWMHRLISTVTVCIWHNSPFPTLCITHCGYPSEAPPQGTSNEYYHYVIAKKLEKCQDFFFVKNDPELSHSGKKKSKGKRKNITKTYQFDPPKPHFYIVKLGFTGVYIIFLISAQNIDCGYSLEPPQWGEVVLTSTHNLFWAEMWKISEFLSENFPFLVVKFSVHLNRYVFVMAKKTKKKKKKIL